MKVNIKNYTKQMQSKIYSQWGEFDDYNEDYTALIDMLNNADAFRTFGDGLLHFMQKKLPELTAENAVKVLKQICAEKGIELSDIASESTLKNNWFRGDKRPKKGDDSRRSMFALAFALELSPAETAELFHKVYLDRAFDYRNANEIVYYFCLNNKKSWADATRLILAAEKNGGDSNEHTIYTAQIKSEIDLIASEEGLLSYISTHRRNLDKNNESAKRNIELLISKAKKIAVEDSELPDHEDYYKGSNKDSVNFLYEIIVDQSVSGKKGTDTPFKNARLPKEIKNRFPSPNAFNLERATYEELRKLIILLFSYTYWYEIPKRDDVPTIEDYISDINVYLTDSGFAPMYYGNPYDWLFLFCSDQDNSKNWDPLGTFRGILAEVLETAED